MEKRQRQRKEREPKPKFTEIRYEVDPPILDQCGSCMHATITPFIPPYTCPLPMEMAAIHIECKENHDCWQEGSCANFVAGAPEIKTTLVTVQN